MHTGNVKKTFSASPLGPLFGATSPYQVPVKASSSLPLSWNLLRNTCRPLDISSFCCFLARALCVLSALRLRAGRKEHSEAQDFGEPSLSTVHQHRGWPSWHSHPTFSLSFCPRSRRLCPPRAPSSHRGPCCWMIATHLCLGWIFGKPWSVPRSYVPRNEYRKCPIRLNFKELKIFLIFKTIYI